VVSGIIHQVACQLTVEAVQQAVVGVLAAFSSAWYLVTLAYRAAQDGRDAMHQCRNLTIGHHVELRSWVLL
jgi:hypothetical protein